MGKLKKGINGPFFGKVGPVVGSSWNGIDYIKAKPIRSAPFTNGELNNQSRFKNINAWLKPIRRFIKVGFAAFSPHCKGYAAAVAYLAKHAYNGSTIDPSLMKVSAGSLPLPAHFNYSLQAGNQLLVTWDTVLPPGAHAHDQAMLLAYDVEAGKQRGFCYGQFRSVGSDKLQLLSGPHVYHLYVAFIAADRSRQSDSVYLGVVST